MGGAAVGREDDFRVVSYHCYLPLRFEAEGLIKLYIIILNWLINIVCGFCYFCHNSYLLNFPMTCKGTIGFVANLPINDHSPRIT